MPTVSIIVPCYNEQDTIQMLLDAIHNQTYPRHEMEVIIADGLSTDKTSAIISDFQHKHPDLIVVVVENRKRNIPAGLNLAIKKAQGEYILRLDAHSIPYPDYVERCVASLSNNLGDNVGGVWEIRPGGMSWQARSIASAASHPLGVGDARYRLGGQAQYTDTVPFGAYQLKVIEKIGGFDESLLSNEDYELNVRLRQAGGKIWLDPAIRSVYFARSTISSLAIQYWRYGYWKARMLYRYPSTFRWRQLAGLFVLSFLVLGVSGIWLHLARVLLGLEIIVYTSALFASGAQIAIKKHEPILIFGLPIAIATMHFAWGTGFLWSFMSLIPILNKR